MRAGWGWGREGKKGGRVLLRETARGRPCTGASCLLWWAGALWEQPRRKGGQVPGNGCRLGWGCARTRAAPVSLGRKGCRLPLRHSPSLLPHDHHPLPHTRAPRRYCAPMYIDIEKVEITRTPEGDTQEESTKYDKVFLAKVRPCARMYACVWKRVCVVVRRRACARIVGQCAVPGSCACKSLANVLWPRCAGRRGMGDGG